MNSQRRLLSSILVGLTLALNVPSAHAAGASKGPLTGYIGIECQINLPSFPNPVKTTSPPCVGVSVGVLVGMQATAPGGVVSAAMAAAPTSLGLQYFAPCPPVLHSANGVATIGGVSVANVTKGASANLSTGTLSFPYTFTVLGTVIIITTGKLTTLVDPKWGSQMKLSWPQGSASDAVGGIGLGAAIPLGVPDLTNCPGGPLTLQIIANIVSLG
jgi:hypothetical protein